MRAHRQARCACIMTCAADGFRLPLERDRVVRDFDQDPAAPIASDASRVEP